MVSRGKSWGNYSFVCSFIYIFGIIGCQRVEENTWENTQDSNCPAASLAFNSYLQYTEIWQKWCFFKQVSADALDWRVKKNLSYYNLTGLQDFIREAIVKYDRGSMQIWSMISENGVQADSYTSDKMICAFPNDFSLKTMTQNCQIYKEYLQPTATD